MMEKAFLGDSWEGRVVEGRFPLLNCLGGTENCALYFTVLQGMQEAVIQLIATDEAQAKTDIAQWDFAKSLAHPYLAKLLASGRCVIDGKSLVYVVGESSTTNLAKTIESGRLEIDRAIEIFDPIVEALQYLHSHGVVHGHLSPANIHFAGSKPRLLLTDLTIAGPVERSVSAPGNYDAGELRNGEVTAAADIWSLGLTMWESMMPTPPSPASWRDEEPEIPVSMPSPFREIVQECLRHDPARRCALEAIQERLRAKDATPVSQITRAVPIANPASEVRLTEQPAAFNGETEIEKEETSEAPVFSGSLAHFEEAHLPRSRVLPYAFVLIAAIAVGAFLFMREHKAGALSAVTENATKSSAPSQQKQVTTPAATAAEQTEPAQTQPGTGPAISPEQGRDSSQAHSSDSQVGATSGGSEVPPGDRPGEGTGVAQSGAPKAPTVNQPAPLDHERADRVGTEENAKGIVEKRTLPSASPGAREGMTRPVEVLIRVSVNPEGAVSDASYVVPGPGNYFARIAQRAALSWKFKPPVHNGDRERSVWMLKFNFARAGTEATATEQEE